MKVRSYYSSVLLACLATSGCLESVDAVSPTVESENLTWYLDADGDSFGDPDSEFIGDQPSLGYVDNLLDCDDTNSEINPLGVEKLIDGEDNNCDGVIDEGLYSIGDRGPSGGKVFFASSGRMEYIRVDVTTFGCSSAAIIGVDDISNNGSMNTDSILDQCDDPNSAAQSAREFDDGSWNLASLNELQGLFNDYCNPAFNPGPPVTSYCFNSGAFGYFLSSTLSDNGSDAAVIGLKVESFSSGLPYTVSYFDKELPANSFFVKPF